jgi:signal transduction histidine kinase
MKKWGKIFSAFSLICITIFLSLQCKDSEKVETSKVQDFNISNWIRVETPAKGNLTSIRMLSPDLGFITGEFLLNYDGANWVYSHAQPPTVGLHCFYALDDKNIWIASHKYSNESDFYYFNGEIWKLIAHPFANQISAMHLREDHTGWIGGDREIAYFNKENWIRIPFPTLNGAVQTIFGNGQDEAWIFVFQGQLYFYDKGKWIAYFEGKNIRDCIFDSINKGLVLADSSVYSLSGKEFRIHSSSPLLNNVNKIFMLRESEGWGIGRNGFVVHFKDGEWEKVSIPSNENLIDISFTSRTNGWITGENGLLLRFGTIHKQQEEISAAGFNKRQIAPLSKEIIDEYGVAMEDFNGDGLKDLYAVCIFDQNRLYVNRSEISSDSKILPGNLFSEEAVIRGISGLLEDIKPGELSALYLGIGAADVDNDGDPDIYLCSLNGKNRLFLNNGNGYFRDVSRQKNRAAGGVERTNAAIFGDIDNDGDLDLFITNENATNRLFLNDGNGYFTDITEESGLKSLGGGMGASFADVDGDGWLDLCVVNWADENRLYKNISSKESGVKFIDVSKEAGIEGEPYTKSNAVVFADFNNDGMLDLFITNRKTSNRLYKNLGDFRFEDVTESIIGLDSMLSYGASFADFDNDGYLDLYVANVGENVLYKNFNGQKFIPVTELYNAELGGYSTGTAAGDIDNDGDIDLYVANFINSSSMLFVNNLNNKNFLIVKAEGTKSNRDAIGAKILLYENGHAGDKNYLVGSREINGGSGYCSNDAKEAHFGVSEELKYDLLIEFPASGIKKKLTGLTAGQFIVVAEEEGLQAFITLSLKSINQYLTDPESVTEILKLILVAGFVFASAVWGKKRYKWNWRLQILLHSAVVTLYLVQTIIFMYEELLFSSILPLSSVIILLALVHLVFDRVIMVRISRAEKEATRNRIARDLHDDLASTLSSTAIYSSILRRSLKNISDEHKELLEKINKLLLEASESITDIVWAVSPLHDKLENLIVRIRVFIADNCKANGINLTANIDLTKSSINISDLVKRNIYLIFKEAMNNIIKHAGASNVEFSALLQNDSLSLTLKDDGNGFDLHKIVGCGENIISDKPALAILSGHGIRNISERAKEITADLNIQTSPGNGTIISLKLKLTQMHH